MAPSDERPSAKHVEVASVGVRLLLQAAVGASLLNAWVLCVVASPSSEFHENALEPYRGHYWVWWISCLIVKHCPAYLAVSLASAGMAFRGLKLKDASSSGVLLLCVLVLISAGQVMLAAELVRPILVVSHIL